MKNVRLLGCLLAVMCMVGGSAWGCCTSCDDISPEDQADIERAYQRNGYSRKDLRNECCLDNGLFAELESDENLLEILKQIVDQWEGPHGFCRLVGADWTPLHIVAKKGCVKSIEYILSFSKIKKLFLNIPLIADKAFTPLFMALLNGHFDAAKTLVTHGARADLKGLREGPRMWSSHNSDVTDEDFARAKKDVERFILWYENVFLRNKSGDRLNKRRTKYCLIDCAIVCK